MLDLKKTSFTLIKADYNDLIQEKHEKKFIFCATKSMEHVFCMMDDRI